MLSSRERSLTHYEVLGVSPTCATEIIEATYQTLMRKYGGRDGESERIEKIEAAYHALKDPQRRLAYDTTIGKTAPATAVVKTWIDRLRPGSSESAPSSPAEAVAPGETVTPRTDGAASPTSPQPAAPTVERSPSHDPAVGGGRPDKVLAVTPVPFTTDPSAAGSSASLTDLLLPADDSPEEPIYGRGFGWSRVGLPLAGVLAVIAAAWSAQFLIDGSPGGNGTEARREASAAGGPNMIIRSSGVATPQPNARGADQEASFEGAKQLPMPPPPAEEATDASTELRQNAAAPVPSSADQINVAPQAESSPSVGSTATQSAIPAPAAAAPEASQAAPPPAITERQSEVASAPVQQSRAAPARWISGGLLNSDNEGGRFEGVVGVRILVRPDGRAGGCRVTQSSGNASLDDVTCQLVRQRLQFSPARNATGQAVQSEVSTTYTWGRRVRKK